MAIGVNSIIKVQNMAAVAMAVILSCCIGSAIHLEVRAKDLLKIVTDRVFNRTV